MTKLDLTQTQQRLNQVIGMLSFCSFGPDDKKVRRELVAEKNELLKQIQQHFIGENHEAS